MSEKFRDVLVFRIQDKAGRGPFKPGFTKVWADAGFAAGMAPLPSWIEEFGPDIVELVLPGEQMACAVRTAPQLMRWFSATEQSKLASYGYNVVAMKADRIIAESSNQVVIARKQPFNKGVTILPWPFFPEQKPA